MKMEETKEEEDGLLHRPEGSGVIMVPPPPSRSTDNGDDDEQKPPPTHRPSIMMSPPAEEDEKAVTKTAVVTLPQITPVASKTPAVVPPTVNPPFKTNRTTKGEGGPRKTFHRVHKIDRQDETVSTQGEDRTNPPQEENESLSMMILPGAVSVGGIATHSGVRPATPTTVSTGPLSRDTVEVVDPTRGTTTTRESEPQIVAFLAPNDSDQQVEARIAQKAEELVRRQMEEGELVVASEMNNDDSSCYCYLKKRTLILLGILSLLLITGGVLGGVLYSAEAPVVVSVAPTSVPTSAPTTLEEVLVDDLISLGAISEEDPLLFSDPMSPQSQALAWMKNDTIVMTPGRSTLDVLQRYVLAVLFYSTANGAYWDWFAPYLSSNDVCSWNKETDGFGVRYGVYCRCGNGSVTTLLLSQNSLLGQLPWELALLTDLEIINLSSNKLTGWVPAEFGQLRSLKSLDISSNLISGTVPTEVGQLQSLGYFDISSNWITGTIPTELSQLISLNSLIISDNFLNGTIPTELGQLVSLSSLEISDTFLSGTIPTGLGGLTSLTSLMMWDNKLTGTVPTELGQLVSLTSLDISYNRLIGTIPTELGQLRNPLIGTIPTSLENNDNRFNDTIPMELGQLLSLEYLDISANSLTGTIPTELGQLLSLTSLAITDNRLTGTIPTELAGLGNMNTFFFSENALTGSLEQSFCAENHEWYLLVDRGEVECSCCANYI